MPFKGKRQVGSTAASPRRGIFSALPQNALGSDFVNDRTIYHVLLIGQSNATGAYTGNNAYLYTISDTPASDWGGMFRGSVRCGINPVTGNVNVTDPASALSEFLTLTEVNDDVGLHGETVSSGFAAQMALMLPGKRFLFSSSAIDGRRYNDLAQGTTPYNNTKTQVTSAKAVCDALGLPYRVLCILCIHGEADQSFLNTNYAANLLTWYNNYNTDLKAISGQTQNIPFYADQQAGFAQGSNSATSETQASVYQLWQANLADPDKIIMVNPRYQYSYYSDLLHVMAWDKYHMGAQFAKVVYQNQFLNQQWNAFVCTSATLSGSTITANFDVPVPPLVIDRTRVTAVSNLGFSYTDDTSPPAISSVTLGSTTATIELAAAPTGSAASRRLRYAWGGTSTSCGGFNNQTATSTNRGNVRDSDTTTLARGYAGANWLCSFSIGVS